MKNIAILTLVACISLATSDLSAHNKPHKESSPESIVSCTAGNGDFLSVVSVPAAFDMGHCKAFLDTCAPCIVSLENQGCKVIDVKLSHIPRADDGVPITASSYLLSCVDP